VIGKRPKVRRRQRAFIARQRRRNFTIQVAGIFVTPTHTITIHIIPKGK
jgi:hypothetical protein